MVLPVIKAMRMENEGLTVIRDERRRKSNRVTFFSYARLAIICMIDVDG